MVIERSAVSATCVFTVALLFALRRNGFEPVGPRRTTCWFFLHHWYKTFQSRVFAARQGDGIALAYRLRAWDRWRLCFVTAFSDGAIVETANQMESFRIDEPDHLRWGLATPDRGLLLERHREACRDFAGAGSRSVALLPAEEVSRLNRHHESRHHRKSHRWTGLKSVGTSLWPSVVAPVPWPSDSFPGDSVVRRSRCERANCWSKRAFSQNAAWIIGL